MQYAITFLEGIITFISPCVLPMVPLYIMYFAGDGTQENKKSIYINALGFILGFTLLFVPMGLFAGAVGGFLLKYRTAVNIAAGLIIILFGLNYMGIFRIKLLNNTIKPNIKVRPNSFFAAVLFGIVYAVGWSPCTGVFLGSAMLMAASSSEKLVGMLLLLCYSAGLGVPFMLCAVLIDRLKGTFGFIKSHYSIINKVCGAFLIVTGILMMTGLLTKITAALS